MDPQHGSTDSSTVVAIKGLACVESEALRDSDRRWSDSVRKLLARRVSEICGFSVLFLVLKNPVVSAFVF